MKTIIKALIVASIGACIAGCSTTKPNYHSECNASDGNLVKGYFHNLEIGDTSKQVFAKLKIDDPFPDVVKDNFSLTINLRKNGDEKLILYFNDKAKLDTAIIGRNLRIKHKKILEGIFPSHVISYYPTGEKMFEWTGIKDRYHFKKSWTKDGKLIGDGKFENEKRIDGKFWLYQYKPIVIATYLNGKLVSTCDVNGNSVDVSKLPKRSEKELSDFEQQMNSSQLWVK